MRANEYKLMDECVEVGVARSARYLSKRGKDEAARQLEDPDVRAVIEEMVMNEICERWHFEGGDE